MRGTTTDIKNSVCDALCILATERPVEKISIASLIQTTGICRSSFYYHFESVEQVFTYMVNCFCEEYLEVGFRLLDAKAHGDKELLLSAEQALCEVVLSHWERVVFFMKDENYITFRKTFLDCFARKAQTMRAVLIDGSGNRDELLGMTAYDYMVRAAAMNLLSTLEVWVRRGFKETPENFVNLYLRTCGQTLCFEAR